jgi:hypothetical protein
LLRASLSEHSLLRRGASLPAGGTLEAPLEGPCQIFLSSQLHVRVVVGHAHAAMTSNLTGLNGTGAHLLPPGDVGTPEGVQAEAREVVFDCSCRNFECLPNARVPHGPLRVVVLLKEPLLWLRNDLLRNPILLAGNQGPECEYAPAVLGFRDVNVASAVALLDVKGALLQIEVFQWHCQVKGTKPIFSRKRQDSHNSLTSARHLSPLGKSPGSEESMMSGLQMMTTDSE